MFSKNLAGMASVATLWVSVLVYIGSQDNYGQTTGEIANQVQANTEALAQEQIARQTRTERFGVSIMKAARQLVRKGEMKRRDFVRLKVALLSPAFRDRAEDLAVIQMSSHGAEGLEMGENGRINRAAIDWDALLAFLEKFIPLLLQLINALSLIEQELGDSHVFNWPIHSCGLPHYQS